jgi:NAD(P)-dependent dehydrogenase (short-subunit alcohol dehydrogenase family)
VANAMKWDIDILFSNAGIGEHGPACEISVDLVRRTFETNVFAPLELAQKFIRKWVDEKRPGKVVFTSSVAGLISSFRGQAPYFASKHALQCIAESLQEELKPFNIQVQTINPGGLPDWFQRDDGRVRLSLAGRHQELHKAGRYPEILRLFGKRGISA